MRLWRRRVPQWSRSDATATAGRLFAPEAAWNQPLPVDVDEHVDPDLTEAVLGAKVIVHFATPVYWQSPNSVLRRVTVRGGASFEAVPVEHGRGWGEDAVIVDLAGRKVTHLVGLHRRSVGFEAHARTVEPLDGPGAIGGIWLQREVLSTRPTEHALRVTAPLPPFTRLQLDPLADLHGLPPVAVALGRALQDYGAIVVATCEDRIVRVVADRGGASPDHHAHDPGRLYRNIGVDDPVFVTGLPGDLRALAP